MIYKIIFLLVLSEIYFVSGGSVKLDAVDRISFDDRKSVVETNFSLPNGNDKVKAVTTEQVSPIVTVLFSTISSAIQPLLGPLAPIADFLAPIITNQVTELVTNFLNDTVASVEEEPLESEEFTESKNYKAFSVMIPHRGRYVFLSKMKNPQPSTAASLVQPTILITASDVQKAGVQGTLEEFLNRRPLDTTQTFLQQKPSPIKLKKKYYKKKVSDIELNNKE